MGVGVSVALGPRPVVDAVDPLTIKRDATNTGCRTARGSLTAQSADLTITTPGSINGFGIITYNEVTGLLVTGRILVRAEYVHVHDNIVEASTVGASTRHLIDTSHASAGTALIEYNTVSASNYPGIYNNGIGPARYTARYNNVFDVVDGFSAYDTNVGTSAGPDVTIESNYVHDLLFISPDSTHGDNQSHTDGVQIQGGCGTVTIRGNTILAKTSVNSTSPVPEGSTFDAARAGYALSCVMLNTSGSRYKSNVDVIGNWLDGGAYAINGTGTDGGTITIAGNHFSGDHFYSSETPPWGPFSINIALSTTWVIPTSGASANDYESSGTLIATTQTYSSSTLRRYR